MKTKKYLKISFLVLSAFIIGAFVRSVVAGSLTPPGSPASTMYTLDDIYNKLTNNTDAVEADHSFSTPHGTNPTFHTLKQIYEAIPSNAGGGLPKTGQTSCWDASGGSISCAGTGQDGQYLKGTARSYTDNNNNTITDNATGLMWVKDPAQIVPWTTDHGNWATGTSYSVGDLVDDTSVNPNTFYVANTAHTSGSGTFAEDRTAHSSYWTQTVWVRNDDGVYQGQTWQNALTNCGALNYGGRTDWRLPNINELHSLVNYENINPSIDNTAFPNTQSGYYWSSTSYQGDGLHDNAWLVYFSNGYIGNYNKTYTYAVRCVR